MARKFIIQVPVADLRREPVFLPKDFEHHELRQTQLLHGMQLHLVEEQGEWLKIEALEQHRAQGPYPGWVHRSEVKEVKDFSTPRYVVAEIGGHLSFGTYVDDPTHRPIPKKLNRDLLVQDALKFVGMPYLWGGCSSLTSVDCSSLIYLLYRAQGVIIPRDAHDQYLASQPTHFPKPGDPIYLTKAQRMTHVILKIDEETFIESPETGKRIRLLKWDQDLWEEEGKIRFSDRPDAYVYAYRSFSTK